jgi:phosphonate transport system substrate-binding protein
LFNKKLAKIAGAFCSIFIVTACLVTPANSVQDLTIEPDADAQPLDSPDATSTPAPIGQPDNPIVMAAMLSAENSDSMLAFDTVTGDIGQKSNFAIIAEFYTDYPTLLADMENGLIHYAWLPPAAYIYAHKMGFANVIFVTNHYGVDLYGIQFLANRNSGFVSYYDDSLGRNTADVKNALSQFQNKHPCWTSKTSLSGYAVPLGILNQNQLSVSTPAYLKDSVGVIRALYVQGICDFGATYSIIGDPRTSSVVLTDLPDALQQVPVIWKSDAVIPTLNLSSLPDVPTKIDDAVTSAFLDFVKQDNGRAQLSAALDYDIQALKMVNHDFYLPFQEILDSSGIDLQSLLSE